MHMVKRGSGILLHISSLPSPYGIGDLGSGAYRFVDFLADTGQRFWQILPLTLTCPAYGNSPYSSFSAMAGNTLLISPEKLVSNGFLSMSDIGATPKFPSRRTDYDSVIRFKDHLFEKAFSTNRHMLQNHNDFQKFCMDNTEWLDDFSLFLSIKDHLGGIEWGQWPVELRDRHEDALAGMSEQLSESILKIKFLQYLFFNQWNALKNYCDSKGITIIGDIPIYVNYDSADVWSNQAIFSLTEEKKPLYVAGVPPDYFSSTGQLWGHPVYNWDVLGQSDYAWWMKRIRNNLRLYHMFRLDHFRAFVGYWQVHASETTAVNGKWMEAPAEDFFNTLIKHFPDISIIAEDLGIITDDVKEIIRKFGFPGMKVLLFAFGDNIPSNPYAPHNHVKNCVVYTGTHDNNTVRGWYKKELSEDNRKRVADYMGRAIDGKTIHMEMVRIAMMSVADMAIIPMQDILGLGEKDRMNLPASSSGNWEWRLAESQISASITENLRHLTTIYGRC